MSNAYNITRSEIYRRAAIIRQQRPPVPDYVENDSDVTGSEFAWVRESRAESLMPMVRLTDQYLSRPSPELAAELRKAARGE